MTPRRTGSPWTVGVIGCGRMGHEHAKAYAQHPRFELAAVMHPDEGSRRTFQDRWRIPRGVASLHDLLAGERLDVVSLCSPTALHAAQAAEVLQALHRPRVLFIEKPVCQTSDELRQLTALAQQTGVSVVVNHTRRFDPTHRRVADVIRSGRLGALLEGRCTYYGGWLNNGTHLIDTLRLLFAEDPQLLSAWGSHGGRGDDHNIELTIRVGGAEVAIEAVDESYYQLYESDFRFEGGRIRLLDGGASMVAEQVAVNALNERILVPILGFPCDGLVQALTCAVDAIDAVLRGSDVWCVLGVDLSTAAETMEWVWRAQALAASHLQMLDREP